MISERDIHGTRVRIECDASLAPAAQDVFATVERLTGSAAPAEGLRVRFGWSILTLQREPDWALRVCEPDFAADAIGATRPTLDTTLSVLARQVALLRRVGAMPQEVGFEQAVVVARRAHTARSIVLMRSSPLDAGDSGWFIDDALATEAADESQLAVRRVFELLAYWPAALATLILPAGYRVVLQGEQVVQVWDDAGRGRWVWQSAEPLP